MNKEQEAYLNAAPDGSNCVTIVTSAPATSPSGNPTAIITQFLEDEDGEWCTAGRPAYMPVSQIPELISMLKQVLGAFETRASRPGHTSRKKQRRR